MSLEQISTINLGETYFCLDCEVLTNCSEICPVCGHRQLWLLENWIGKINARENGSDREGTLKGGQLAPVFLTP